MLRLLLLLFFIGSCSTFQQRGPASLGEYYQTYKHQFRFYNFTKYLPNKVKIYQRSKGSAFLKMFFTPSRKLEKDELVCTHTWSKSNEIKKIKLDMSDVTSIDVDYFTDDIICSYKESEQNEDESQADSLLRYDVLDLNVEYNFKYHQLEPYDKLIKQQKEIVQNYNKLEKQIAELNAGNIDVIDGLDFELESTKYQLNQNQSEVTIKVSKNNKIKLKDIHGEILFGWGRFKKKIGPEGLPEKSYDYIAPNINKMAFICGQKNGNTFKILQSGKNEKTIEGIEGELICKINHKKGYTVSLIGEINFSVESASKESLLKAAKSKLEELAQNKDKVEKLIEEQMIEKTKMYEKMLLADINPLFVQSQKTKDSEPPKYCSEEIEHAYNELKLNKGHYMQKGGEWCSTPEEYDDKYFSICDSRNLPAYFGKGRIIVFNKNNKRLSTIIVDPVEGENESFNASKKLLKIVVNGEFKSFVMTTYDGRILYIDENGKIEKEVKVPHKFLYNPMVNGQGEVVFIGRDGAMDNTPASLYIYDMYGNILHKKTHQDFTLTSSYQLLGDKIVIGTYEGELIILDFELNELRRMSPEKGMYTSDITEKGGLWYFGSKSGRIYSYDYANDSLKMIFRIPHSGTADYDLSKRGFVENKRSISFAPKFFKDGSIVLLSHLDSRLHFFSANWEYQYAVATRKVKSNYTFDLIELPDGSEGISVSTTSYMHLYNKDGTYFARGVFSQSENMHSPKKVAADKYMYGVSRGVYTYKVVPQDKKFKTIKLKACP